MYKQTCTCICAHRRRMPRRRSCARLAAKSCSSTPAARARRTPFRSVCLIFINHPSVSFLFSLSFLFYFLFIYYFVFYFVIVSCLSRACCHAHTHNNGLLHCACSQTHTYAQYVYTHTSVYTCTRMYVCVVCIRFVCVRFVFNVACFQQTPVRFCSRARARSLSLSHTHTHTHTCVI